jgi:hypothetical protein
MGHEFCAEIIDYGPSTTKKLKAGTRVCSVPVLIHPDRLELAAFFLFSSGENAGKIVCERVYFDNELLMRQIRGEADAPNGIGLAELSRDAISSTG